MDERKRTILQAAALIRSFPAAIVVLETQDEWYSAPYKLAKMPRKKDRHATSANMVHQLQEVAKVDGNEIVKILVAYIPNAAAKDETVKNLLRGSPEDAGDLPVKQIRSNE